MALVDRVNECNNAKMFNYLPFYAAGRRVGWIRDTRRDLLEPFDCFIVSPRRIDFSLAYDGYDAITAAMDGAQRKLAADGHIKGWADERFSVRPHFGMDPVFAMERAGCPFFGVRTWAVHVLAFVWRKESGPHFWVGKRAAHLLVYPGKLDSTVGGGQPEGLSVEQNLIDECAEEAGIPETFARRAKPVGCISYRHETEAGVSPDQIFCFDLQLPEDFTPHSADGEVEAFTLIHWRDVFEILADGNDFKMNSALVYINFFARHGLLRPDEVPDYAEICAGLGAN